MAANVSPGPTLASKVIFGCVCGIFVTQFMSYFNDPLASAVYGLNDSRSAVVYSHYHEHQASGTGWQIHPYAPIAFLAAVGLMVFAKPGSAWTRYKHWLIFGLMIPCVVPGASSEPGADWGFKLMAVLFFAAIAQSFMGKPNATASTDQEAPLEPPEPVQAKAAKRSKKIAPKPEPKPTKFQI